MSNTVVLRATYIHRNAHAQTHTDTYTYLHTHAHTHTPTLTHTHPGTRVLGDEIHIMCHCPATKGVLQQFTAKFQGLTRLLDLSPFASFTPDEKTQMVLGNPPPQVLQKA